MISTIAKYPWHAIDNVTLGDRLLLYNAVRSQIRALATCIRRNASPMMLTPILLQELVVTTLSCPGFSEQQKAYIVEDLHASGFGHMSKGQGLIGTLGGTLRYSSVWPFEVLGKKPEASEALLEV